MTTVSEELRRKKKISIQILFWVLYYILFSFIWVKNNDYKSSFYLEFILLPIRIFAVYFTVLYLIPQFLLNKKFIKFILYYAILLIIAGVSQRFFIYFFFDNKEIFNIVEILEINLLIRSIILINSTIFFVSSIYILHLYFKERSKKEIPTNNFVLLKSNRRVYRVQTKDIIYIEGLGNYVNYMMSDGKKITVYQSLKKCLENLSDDFIRIQKSSIINKNHIKSYNNESVEMTNGEFISIGNSFDFNLLPIE